MPELRLRDIPDEITLDAGDKRTLVFAIRAGGETTSDPTVAPHLILDLELTGDDEVFFRLESVRVSHGHATALILALSGALKHARDAAEARGWVTGTMKPAGALDGL